jgi:hypothetical protein
MAHLSEGAAQVIGVGESAVEWSTRASRLPNWPSNGRHARAVGESTVEWPPHPCVAEPIAVAELAVEWSTRRSASAESTVEWFDMPLGVAELAIEWPTHPCGQASRPAVGDLVISVVDTRDLRWRVDR